MNKNAVYWIGVKADQTVSDRFKYGDYSWMDYSRKTWEYYCRKHNITFVHYDQPTNPNLMEYKVNWQRWLDLEKYVKHYDNILLVDASIMVRWDCPNYFELNKEDWCCLKADENWKWTYESATGYADMFPDVNFNHKDYFSSGFVLFRRKHLPMIKELVGFYWDNHKEILKREDETVLKGRDQPIVNYFVQKHQIPVHFWNFKYGVSHLYRREILGGNWQLGDPTPFFIKYFYTWIFSGFSDRGKTRTELMSKTWEITKDNYI